MQCIGIFCSASNAIDDVYFDAARMFGEWMGMNGKTLVYGGSNLGLMECIAKAVKDNGGHVTGVVPADFEKKGRESLIPDEIIRTKSLSDRKDTIIAKSDVLVALPGGIGTLDEALHVMSSSILGYHQKKVILYNVEGFYNDLLLVMDMLIEKNFAHLDLSNYYRVAQTQSDLTRELESIQF